MVTAAALGHAGPWAPDGAGGAGAELLQQLQQAAAGALAPELMQTLLAGGGLPAAPADGAFLEPLPAGGASVSLLGGAPARGATREPAAPDGRRGRRRERRR